MWMYAVWHRYVPALKWAVAALAILVALNGAVSFFLADWLEQRISAKLDGATVQIGSARLSLTAVRLNKLAIYEQPPSVGQAPTVYVRKVKARLSLVDWLAGRPAVRAIELKDANATVIYDPARGWNVMRWLTGRAVGDKFSFSLPVIHLTQGSVQALYRSEQAEYPLAALYGDVHVQPCPVGRAAVFELWLEPKPPAATSRLTGTIDFQPDGVARVSVSGAVQMSQSHILANRWTMQHLTARAAVDRNGIQIQTALFQAGQTFGSVSGFAQRDSKTFQANLDIHNLFIGPTTGRNGLSYSHPAVGMLFGQAVGQFLEQFQPTGQADVRLTVAGCWQNSDSIQLNGSVWCQGMQVSEPILRRQLRQLYGEIVLQQQTIVFPALVGEYESWSVCLSGGVGPLGSQPAVWLFATTGRIALDESVYRLLPPAAQGAWQTWMPSGWATVDLRYRKLFDQPEWLELTARIYDTRVVCAFFPYPLEHLNGVIVVRPDQLVIQNLATAYPPPDERSVQVFGQISIAPSAAPQADVKVTIRQLPYDIALTAALRQTPLAERYGVILDALQTDARLNVYLRLRTSEHRDGWLTYQAAGNIEGHYLVWQNRTIPLERFGWQFELSPEELRISDGFLVHDSGRIHFGGGVCLGANGQAGAAGSVQFDCHNWPLDKGWWSLAREALPTLPAGITVGGRVDASGWWHWHSAAPRQNGQIQLNLPDNPLYLHDLPAGTVSLQALIEPTQIELRNVLLRHLDAAADWQTVLPAAGSWLSRYTPRGFINGRLPFIRLPLAEGALAGIEAFGQMDFSDLALAEPVPMVGANGTISGWLYCQPPHQLQGLSVTLCAEPLWLAGRFIDRLDARLAYDPHQRTFHINQAQIGIGSGTVNGVAALEWPAGGWYRVQATIKDIEVHRLLTPTENALTNGQADEQTVQRGFVSGIFNAQGRWQEGLPSEGRLELTGYELRLGQQTLLGKVLTAAQLRMPRAYLFNQMELQAHLAGSRMHFERIWLDGPTAALTGDGQMDIKTQEISLNFYLMGRLSQWEPIILGRLVKGFGRVFWRIEARNTYTEPQIRATPLPILQVPLDLLERLMR